MKRPNDSYFDGLSSLCIEPEGRIVDCSLSDAGVKYSLSQLSPIQAKLTVQATYLADFIMKKLKALKLLSPFSFEERKDIWVYIYELLLFGEGNIDLQILQSLIQKYLKSMAKIAVGRFHEKSGLLTPSAGDEIIERLKVTRAELNVIALFVDYDGFKYCNDTHGHLAADEVIRGIGKIILDHIKGGDVAIHFGGDEELLLLPVEDDGAILFQLGLEIGKRLRKTIADAVFTYNNVRMKQTVSIGVGFGKCGNLETVIDNADVAMYRAKENGKNRVVVNLGWKY